MTGSGRGRTSDLTTWSGWSWNQLKKTNVHTVVQKWGVRWGGWGRQTEMWDDCGEQVAGERGAESCHMMFFWESDSAAACALTGGASSIADRGQWEQNLLVFCFLSGRPPLLFPPPPFTPFTCKCEVCNTFTTQRQSAHIPEFMTWEGTAELLFSDSRGLIPPVVVSCN